MTGYSYFNTPLTATAVRGGWKLDRDFIYYSDYLGKPVIVPTGFFTDLASIPRLLRWLVPVANAKNRRAAVVHDYLCGSYIQYQYGITQRDADRVFREALDVCNVNTFGQWFMWAPVRGYQWAKGVIGK